MRPDKLYLVDIVDAADAIHRFCSSVSEESFIKDELRQSAVLQKFIVIGEAAAHLSEDFQNKHAGIEWADIIGFRNIAVHEYFAVLWSIVWMTAIQDVPPLRDQIARILAVEFTDN